MNHSFLANAYTELKLIEFAFIWKLLEVVVSSQGRAGPFHQDKSAKIVVQWQPSAPKDKEEKIMKT